MDENGEFYNADMDDNVIPLGYVTTYILELLKSQEIDLGKLSLRDKISSVWNVFIATDDLKDSLNIDNLWEKKSLRKSWSEAERMRKIGNSKYAKDELLPALSSYNEALSYLPFDIKDKNKDLYPTLIANRSLVLHKLGYHTAALKDIQVNCSWNIELRTKYVLF